MSRAAIIARFSIRLDVSLSNLSVRREADHARPG